MTIAVAGSRPLIEVGGRVLTDVDNLISLYWGIDTGGRWSTLRKLDDTAGYQVTTGKTLVLFASKLISLNASTAMMIALGYGDTDVGLDSPAAPTNPVYAAGLDGSAGTQTKNLITIPDAVNALEIDSLEYSFHFEVPASKYPVARSGSGASFGMLFYGYEKDA